MIPAVLAVLTSSGAVALVGSSGCGDDEPPRQDAAIGDAGVDTPIV